MRTLRDLVQRAYPDAEAEEALGTAAIRGLAVDSRAVRPGDLFFAIRGERADGMEYLSEALSRGASAVASDRPRPQGVRVPWYVLPEGRISIARLAASFYGHPSEKIRSVGITGTNGKTTSTYLLEHFLMQAGRRAAVFGTINYRLGDRVFAAVETTPGPVRLQELLAAAVEADCAFAVMEVSSHALSQNRTEGIRYDAALFTNLTQDHLDYYGTMEAYFEAKAKLFTGLEPGAVAVLNGDDPWSARLAERTRARVVRYGIRQEAEVRAENVELGLTGTRFDWRVSGRSGRVQMPLVGWHNVYNALGTLAVADALGLDAARCAESLGRFAGVPGRLETVRLGQPFLLFIDYAHTPDGLLNVLKSLEPYKKRRLLVVFGCGGDRDRAKRPLMGRIASEHSDYVYVTSDNPRSEDPSVIANEVRSGFPEGFDRFAVVTDRAKAIRRALLDAREGDIVLLAGKGHEAEQVVGTQRMPFSDRAVAEKVLHGL